MVKTILGWALTIIGILLAMLPTIYIFTGGKLDIVTLFLCSLFACGSIITGTWLLRSAKTQR